MTNLCVAVRVRPSFYSELGDAGQSCITVKQNQITLTDIRVFQGTIVVDNRKRKRIFSFDHIFEEGDNVAGNCVQQEIFERIGRSTLESTLEGYNSSIFAYGLTGTGKTYTIFGSKDAPGLAPRLCQAISRHIQVTSKASLKLRQKISVLEIYNERIRDLLIDPNPGEELPSLRVREHPVKGPYVEGLTVVDIKDTAHINAILTQAIANRKTAENNVHFRSSRSHVICTIYYHETKCESNYSTELETKLSLVDLAGSEKSHKTPNATRFEEGRSINLSLSSLSNVISKLAEKSQRESLELDDGTNSSMSTGNSLRSSRHSGLSQLPPIHVPYRNSKLTWLLSDSLGGNSKTTMIATISSCYADYQEILNTLRYAQQAKMIVNQPRINLDASSLYIRQLLDEISVLKQQLYEKNMYLPITLSSSTPCDSPFGFVCRRFSSEGDLRHTKQHDDMPTFTKVYKAWKTQCSRSTSPDPFIQTTEQYKISVMNPYAQVCVDHLSQKMTVHSHEKMQNHSTAPPIFLQHEKDSVNETDFASCLKVCEQDGEENSSSDSNIQNLTFRIVEDQSSLSNVERPLQRSKISRVYRFRLPLVRRRQLKRKRRTLKSRLFENKKSVSTSCRSNHATLLRESLNSEENHKDESVQCNGFEKKIFRPHSPDNAANGMKQDQATSITSPTSLRSNDSPTISIDNNTNGFVNRYIDENLTLNLPESPVYSNDCLDWSLSSEGLNSGTDWRDEECAQSENSLEWNFRVADREKGKKKEHGRCAFHDLPTVSANRTQDSSNRVPSQERNGKLHFEDHLSHVPWRAHPSRPLPSSFPDLPSNRAVPPLDLREEFSPPYNGSLNSNRVPQNGFEHHHSGKQFSLNKEFHIIRVLLENDAITSSDLLVALPSLKSLISTGVQKKGLAITNLHILEDLVKRITNRLSQTSTLDETFILSSEERLCLEDILEHSEPNFHPNAKLDGSKKVGDCDTTNVWEKLNTVDELLEHTLTHGSLDQENCNHIRNHLRDLQFETLTPNLVHRISKRLDDPNELFDGNLRDDVSELSKELQQAKVELLTKVVEHALEVLYASPFRDQNTPHIHVFNVTAVRKLTEALELACRQNFVNRNDAGFPTVWSLSTQLSKKMRVALTVPNSNSIDFRMRLECRECLLIQHILLTNLIGMKIIRSEAARSEDTHFYYTCLKQLPNTFEYQRSIDVLSPITEICTPETSTFENDNAHMESTSGTCSPFSDSSLRLILNSNSEDLVQNSTKSPGTLSETSESKDSSSRATDQGLTAAGHFKIDNAVMRPIVTYLKSKLLDITTGQLMSNQEYPTVGALEILLARLDEELKTNTIDDGAVQLCKADVKTVKAVLDKDNNPYSRILKRSLESSLCPMVPEAQEDISRTNMENLRKSGDPGLNNSSYRILTCSALENTCHASEMKKPSPHSSIPDLLKQSDMRIDLISRPVAALYILKLWLNLADKNQCIFNMLERDLFTYCLDILRHNTGVESEIQFAAEGQLDEAFWTRVNHVVQIVESDTSHQKHLEDMKHIMNSCITTLHHSRSQLIDALCSNVIVEYAENQQRTTPRKLGVLLWLIQELVSDRKVHITETERQFLQNYDAVQLKDYEQILRVNIHQIEQDTGVWSATDFAELVERTTESSMPSFEQMNTFVKSKFMLTLSEVPFKGHMNVLEGYQTDMERLLRGMIGVHRASVFGSESMSNLTLNFEFSDISGPSCTRLTSAVRNFITTSLLQRYFDLFERTASQLSEFEQRSLSLVRTSLSEFGNGPLAKFAMEMKIFENSDIHESELARLSNLLKIADVQVFTYLIYTVEHFTCPAVGEEYFQNTLTNVCKLLVSSVLYRDPLSPRQLLLSNHLATVLDSLGTDEKDAVRLFELQWLMQSILDQRFQDSSLDFVKTCSLLLLYVRRIIRFLNSSKFETGQRLHTVVVLDQLSLSLAQELDSLQQRQLCMLIMQLLHSMPSVDDQKEVELSAKLMEQLDYLLVRLKMKLSNEHDSLVGHDVESCSTVCDILLSMADEISESQHRSSQCGLNFEVENDIVKDTIWERRRTSEHDSVAVKCIQLIDKLSELEGTVEDGPASSLTSESMRLVATVVKLCDEMELEPLAVWTEEFDGVVESTIVNPSPMGLQIPNLLALVQETKRLVTQKMRDLVNEGHSELLLLEKEGERPTVVNEQSKHSGKLVEALRLSAIVCHDEGIKNCENIIEVLRKFDNRSRIRPLDQGDLAVIKEALEHSTHVLQHFTVKLNAANRLPDETVLKYPIETGELKESKDETVYRNDSTALTRALSREHLFSLLLDHSTPTPELMSSPSEKPEMKQAKRIAVSDTQDPMFREKLTERLQYFRACASEHNERDPGAPPNNTITLDPNTTEMLHVCLSEQLQKQVPTLGVMIPLLCVISELEASKDVTIDSAELDQDTSLYIPMDLNVIDLEVTSRWLESVEADTPSLSEQVSALICIHSVMDGEPLWPSEAGLLLSSLQTLAAANDTATKRLLDDLNELKRNLIQHAFVNKSDQDLYEGVGMDLNPGDVKQLRVLHRTCEISVTRKVRSYVQNVLGAVAADRHVVDEMKSQITEMMRLFVLYLSRSDNPSLSDMIIFNRVLINLAEQSADLETVDLLRQSVNQEELFALYETQTTRMSTIILTQSIIENSRMVCSSLPNVLETLLQGNDPDDALSLANSALLFGGLHFLNVVQNQREFEPLASKWRAHLNRLMWRIMVDVIQNRNSKLDVRSRALISIASRHYHGNLSNMFATKSIRLIQKLEAGDSNTSLMHDDCSDMVQVLSVVLSDPRRFKLTPNQAGFLVSMLESIIHQDSLEELSSDQIHFLKERLQSAAEAEQQTNPVEMSDLSISLQATDHGTDSETKTIQQQAVMLYTAYQLLTDETVQASSSFSTGDSQISSDCKAIMGLVKFNMSLLAMATDDTKLETLFQLTPTEVTKLQQVNTFWKPILEQATQTQREAVFQKLTSEEAYCGTNEELKHALSLTFIDNPPIGPMNACIIANKLETVAAVPDEAICLDDQELTAIRSLTPTDTTNSTVAWYKDGPLWASLFYMDSFICATRFHDQEWQIRLRPVDSAVLAASINCLLMKLPIGSSFSKSDAEALRLMQKRIYVSVSKVEDYFLEFPEVNLLDNLMEYSKTFYRCECQRILQTFCRVYGSSESLNAEDRKKLLNCLYYFLTFDCPSEEKLIRAVLKMSDNAAIHTYDASFAHIISECITILNDGIRADSHQASIELCRSYMKHFPRGRDAFTWEFQPKEAFAMLGLIRHLCGVTQIHSLEISLIQATLANKLAESKPWSAWHELPETFEHQLLKTLSFVSRMYIDPHLRTTSSDASSNEQLLDDLQSAVGALGDQTDSVSIGATLKRIQNRLNPGSSSSESRRLKREKHVEGGSWDEGVASLDDHYAVQLMTRLEEVLSKTDDFRRSPEVSVILGQLKMCVPTLEDTRKTDIKRSLSSLVEKSSLKQNRSSLIVELKDLLSMLQEPEPQEKIRVGNSVSSSYNRLSELCNARLLDTHQVAEALTILDGLLLRTTHGRKTPTITERTIHQLLQQSAQTGRGVALTQSDADTLQNYGQRLASEAIKSDRESLRHGLETWLQASVTGSFVFDEDETKKLYHALCIARETIRNEDSTQEYGPMLKSIIDQCASTIDSGLGTELSGPHSMGPCVTEILEEAHRTCELLNSRSSTLYNVLSPGSEWSSRQEGVEHQESRDQLPGTTAGLAESSSTKDEPLTENQPEGFPKNLGLNVCGSFSRTTTEDASATTAPDRSSINRSSTPPSDLDALNMVAEDHKRLRSWEKQIETRLRMASDRVDALRNRLPDSSDDQSTFVVEDDKSEEFEKLQEEMKQIKQQLHGVVRHLQVFDRRRRTSSFAPSRFSPPTGSSDFSKRLTEYQTSAAEKISRLYRSSDCLEDLVESTSQNSLSLSTLFVPYYSQPHRLSSLDRLHELIEIRRAIVAGSRQELCRLGTYSSLPLKLIRNKSPVLAKMDNSFRQRPGEKQLLKGLIERQDKYTKHLLARAHREQNLSQDLLKALETRLDKLEHFLCAEETRQSSR